MFRVLFNAAAALAMVSSAYGAFKWLSAGTVPNKFYVTYGPIPDLTHHLNHYVMPRTTDAAQKDSFSQASANAVDKTTLWCREKDFRVCVHFDARGSVAGVQLSVRVSEMEKDNAPLDILAIPEWRRQTLLGEDVYSTTAYFQSRGDLLAGGRDMTDDTLTAPNGLYLLQTDRNGTETGFQHVSTDEADAPAAGFYVQGCFPGMGQHYFQNLRVNSTCEGHRPYFLLFGPETKQLTGFAFSQYGRVSQGRGWLEVPGALVSKIIAPNSPNCASEWINKYGIFTMHVFFVERSYLTRC